MKKASSLLQGAKSKLVEIPLQKPVTKDLAHHKAQDPGRELPKKKKKKQSQSLLQHAKRVLFETPWQKAMKRYVAHHKAAGMTKKTTQKKASSLLQGAKSKLVE